MTIDVEFGRENRNALLLNSTSADDYVASRCCFLNGLIGQGYILGEQAIEKVLKSAILLIDKNINVRSKKQFGIHNIEQLIIHFGSVANVDCQRFFSMAQKLTEAYELLRYPDNKIKVPGSSYHFTPKFISEVDEVYIFVAEKLNIPDNVKYRTGIFRMLFMSSVERTKYWLQLDNSILKSKLRDWNAEFIRFKQ
ncbi:hypothetical protein [Pollutibacter soli]|uniref:hypothetical protein n=1 Tax=Pollutibacter soli TaxID=3034157 RepID=UPI003013F4E2